MVIGCKSILHAVTFHSVRRRFYLYYMKTCLTRNPRCAPRFRKICQKDRGHRVPSRRNGQIVYQGPREQILEFFEYTGFRCPERKGIADFLQKIMATIALPVFLRTEMKTGQIENSANFWGALFFNLINVMFNGMQELAMILNHRVCTSLLQALWRAQVVANTLGTFTLPMTFVLGGFVVAKGP
ncbi:ABC-2 type transporter domain-containing protein [Forsythia ovata]|uniref:ABC-2 type transporter domain-containing protein n=1 Tax=Forsythia ovata TaxID=205694 RepID=A0ABD1R658_9LAMI